MRNAALMAIMLFLVLASAGAARTCQHRIEPKTMRSVQLCSDNYDAKNIRLLADNIVFDCSRAVLKGDFKSTGLIIEGRKNITVLNCQLAHHETGILIRRSKDIRIIDTSLIRNLVGIKLQDTTGTVVDGAYDISIKEPVQATNSTGNSFSYVNKKVESDNCRPNQCNQATGLSIAQKQKTKEEQPQKALKRSLMDTIRSWLSF